MPSYDTILFKRDTNSNLTASSTVIKNGEPVFDTDNNDLRMGDGTNSWSDLKSVSRKSAIRTTTGAGPYNNWTPVSTHHNVIRVTTTAALTITGIDSTYGNGQITVINHGTTHAITFKEDNTSSSAVNRIYNTPTGDLVLAAGEVALFTYDPSISRWIAVKL